MPSATVTSKGQITLPKKVRDVLRLEPGDRLDFLIQEDGRVLLQPATVDATELKAILHRKGMRTVSVEEMEAAIAKRGIRRR